jgi:hypothetical protein
MILMDSLNRQKGKIEKPVSKSLSQGQRKGDTCMVGHEDSSLSII